MIEKFTCPCCGYKTHDSEDSLWQICEVCFWENEPLTLQNPYYVGGPNSTSLVQAQQNFILFGANYESAKAHVRAPNADEPKDPDWKPIDFEEHLGGSTNENLTKNIKISDKWQQDWHTIITEQYGVKSKQKGIWLLANLERFSIELTYKREPNSCKLVIKESEVIVLHHSSEDLESTKTLLNSWIEKIEDKVETILINAGDECRTFTLPINIHNKIEQAELKCWINWDWGHAQIRNASLKIGEEIVFTQNTFTDFERMLFHLQRNELSEDRRIQTCFFCRYSTYNVAGNDDFGDLNCFKTNKKAVTRVKNKHDIIALFERESSIKVEETHHCPDYADVVPGDGLYKLLVR